MDLEIQIQSIVFSFVFGLFLSLIYNLFYFFLYNNFLILKILSNIIYSISMSLLYFNINYLINSGIIHPYFILLIIIGFILGNFKTRIIRRESKKNERT